MTYVQSVSSLLPGRVGRPFSPIFYYSRLHAIGIKLLCV